MNELIIPLPNGGSLRCGEAKSCVQWGGHIRICDPDGNEIFYWDSDEWEEEGESVIGAVFVASLKSIAELTKNRNLVDNCWKLNLNTFPKE